MNRSGVHPSKKRRDGSFFGNETGLEGREKYCISAARNLSALCGVFLLFNFAVPKLIVGRHTEWRIWGRARNAGRNGGEGGKIPPMAGSSVLPG
jgi:hypothetical protein